MSRASLRDMESVALAESARGHGGHALFSFATQGNPMSRVLTLTISVPLPEGDAFAEADALTRVRPALEQVKNAMESAGLNAEVSHSITSPRGPRKPKDVAAAA